MPPHAGDLFDEVTYGEPRVHMDADIEMAPVDAETTCRTAS